MQKHDVNWYIQNMAKDLANDIYEEQIKEYSINELLDSYIEDIQEDEIRENLSNFYNNKTLKNQFEDELLKCISSYIKNDEYLAKEVLKLNFHIEDFRDDLQKLAKYLNCFLKMDQAYDDLANIDQENDQTILAEVIKELLQRADTLEYIKNFLECPYCRGGGVNSLIYYSDTTRFYERHKYEINYLLNNFLDVSIEELFGERWDKEDRLVLEDRNQNLMAWFGFEEIAYQLYSYIFES